MTTYYAVMAVMSLVILITSLLFFTEKKLNYYILAILAIMAIGNAGYYLIATADTLSVALIGKKISYVGGCFIPPLMLSVIFKVCNISIKKWIGNVLSLYSFAVYGMVLTIGYNDIYYAGVELVKDGDATALIPQYGFCHNFFYVLLYGYLLIGVVILFYSLKTKNQVSRKNLWVLIGVEAMNIVIFLVGRVINPDLEVTNLSYVIDGFLFLYFNRRITVYSLEDNIISSLDKQNDYGYIMFDKNRNYLGANRLAVSILPDLALCRIDRPVSNSQTLDFLQVELDEFEKEKDALFELDKEEKHYEGRINQIWYADRAVGYLFEIANVTDKYKYTKLLSEYNDNLKNEVEEKTAHIRNIQSQVLLGMANMVENRDGNTGGHIKRTSNVIEILINTIRRNHILQLEDKFCQAVIKAAPMHDLGKIGIDDNILRKPGKLTDEEFVIMQTHAEKSGELVESILKDVEDDYFVNVAKNLARHHHEKWNGAGYPDQLQGENIPLEARIMAVADVYDALVSKRCYKEPMSFEQAYGVMMESMGSHFDPQMAEVFEKSRKELEEYYSA
ncbi:MAG: HD domain-containing protein [Lachnospiraceae bacterium]|nr:HD domain-containing protein [Lachnospiraceae bacterium]